MNIFYFDKVVYKGNIDRDFYFFCCKKNKKLLLYVFSHFLYFFLSFFSNHFDLLRFKKYHQYLSKVPNIEKTVADFYEEKKKKLNPWYLKRKKKSNVIIANSPRVIVEPFLSTEKVVSYEFNNAFELDVSTYHNQLKDLGEKCDVCYYSRFADANKFVSKESYIYKNDVIFKDSSLKYYKLLSFAGKVALILALSGLLLLISFSFTTVSLDNKIIGSYFKSRKLLVLNFTPIFLLMLILFIAVKRLWISFSITSAVLFVIGIVNKTKLAYRDDVFKMEDITLVKEAFIMLERYQPIIRWYTVVSIIFCVFVALFLRRYVKKLNLKYRYSIVIAVLLLLGSYSLCKNVYTNKTIYDRVGDKTIINVWIDTQQSQVRGLIYPFIYSVTEIYTATPEGYDEEEAKKILEGYSFDSIEEEKKVNVISIQLEAYNDFSKFGVIDFMEDPYEAFHEIQKNSVSGTLITNVFGGGTINTERRYITGLNISPTYRKPTNSYARYFKSQGYSVEAMHPIYGSFYNRNTVNYNLGFDHYWNYENKFSSLSSGFMQDKDLFKIIRESLVEKNKNEEWYFNFTVTYQNHGPYSSSAVEKTYMKQNGYSESGYNLFNRYLDGIKSTNEALKELVDFLDHYSEPTILIVFGDHNPYLGSVYDELGIDMSVGNVESFVNYYSTPYIIHANDAAKKVLDNDFVGEGRTISPVFLMNEVFGLTGWKGNEYLKYTTDVSKSLSVIHQMYTMEDGNFVLRNNTKYGDLINEYDKVGYYYYTHFKQ